MSKKHENETKCARCQKWIINWRLDEKGMCQSCNLAIYREEQKRKRDAAAVEYVQDFKPKRMKLSRLFTIIKSLAKDDWVDEMAYDWCEDMAKHILYEEEQKKKK